MDNDKITWEALQLDQTAELKISSWRLRPTVSVARIHSHAFEIRRTNYGGGGGGGDGDGLSRLKRRQAAEAEDASTASSSSVSLPPCREIIFKIRKTSNLFGPSGCVHCQKGHK